MGQDKLPFLGIVFDTQSFEPIDHADMMARVLPQLLQWPAAITPLLVHDSLQTSRQALYTCA